MSKFKRAEAVKRVRDTVRFYNAQRTGRLVAEFGIRENQQEQVAPTFPTDGVRYWDYGFADADGLDYRTVADIGKGTLEDSEYGTRHGEFLHLFLYAPKPDECLQSVIVVWLGTETERPRIVDEDGTSCDLVVPYYEVKPRAPRTPKAPARKTPARQGRPAGLARLLAGQP